MNLARQFLATINGHASDYDGYCLELADDVLHFIEAPDAQILYIDAPHDYLRPQQGKAIRSEWRYHAVVFVGGLVHDGWLVEALPVRDYLRKMFSMNGELELTYYDPERVERWVREEDNGNQLEQGARPRKTGR